MPNPIVLLTHLIDSMRDTDGKILVPGFYDDVRPLTEIEKQTLDQTPTADEQLKQELAIRMSEGGGLPLAEQILKPALNVRGVQAVKRKSRTISRVKVFSSCMTTRYGNPPGTRAHCETRMGLGISCVSSRNCKHSGTGNRSGNGDCNRYSSHPGRVARWRIPMYLFEGTNRIPVIGVPISNHDNNQHAANENLRLQNLWGAVQVYAAIFTGFDGPGASQSAAAH